MSMTSSRYRRNCARLSAGSEASARRTSTHGPLLPPAAGARAGNFEAREPNDPRTGHTWTPVTPPTDPTTRRRTDSTVPGGREGGVPGGLATPSAEVAPAIAAA